jgi:sigma-B regulation protein RsbU (phosphoserine phosphatase)
VNCEIGVEVLDMAAMVQIPRLRYAEEVAQICAKLSAASELPALLHTAAFQIRQVMGCSIVVFTKPASEPIYVPGASIGVSREELVGVRFTAADSLLARLDGCAPADDSAQLRAARAVFVVPIRRRRELIGFLALGQNPHARRYDEDDCEFLMSIADQLAICIENFRLRDQDWEFARVRELQERLLPKTALVIEGFEIAHVWRPARSVSGDYFDVLDLGGGKVGLCIADVVGKGMPAALLMSNVQAAVKALASEVMTPGQVCERVNRVLAGNLAAGSFVTLFYAVLDRDTRRLVYTNAGHTPPMVVRCDGSIERLESGGALLGVFKRWTFEHGEVTLEEGDRLVLFTDGITELQDPTDDEFGEERLAQLVREHRAVSAGELTDRIVSALMDFNNGVFQDDVTVVVLSAGPN